MLQPPFPLQVAKQCAHTFNYSVILRASLGDSAVENPPVMQEPQETWVQSLGQEDTLEESMPTSSRILAWRIPWTEEPDGVRI